MIDHKSVVKKAGQIFDEVFVDPYRRSLLREQRNLEDFFALLCFAELLGLPNPISYYTIELYPYFYNDFHAWHKRMGMEHSPLAGFPCC